MLPGQGGNVERTAATGAEGICECGYVGVEVDARDGPGWMEQVRFSQVGEPGGLGPERTLMFLAVWQGVVQRTWLNGGIEGNGLGSGQRGV